jgi:hypothetical protein
VFSDQKTEFFHLITLMLLVNYKKQLILNNENCTKCSVEQAQYNLTINWVHRVRKRRHSHWATFGHILLSLLLRVSVHIPIPQIHAPRICFQSYVMDVRTKSVKRWILIIFVLNIIQKSGSFLCVVPMY